MQWINGHIHNILKMYLEMYVKIETHFRDELLATVTYVVGSFIVLKVILYMVLPVVSIIGQ